MSSSSKALACPQAALALPLCNPLPCPTPKPFRGSHHSTCHAPGLRWKALSKEEKAKYSHKGDSTPPSASAPGGHHARPLSSTPCSSLAPITTAGVVPDQVPSAAGLVRSPVVESVAAPPRMRTPLSVLAVERRGVPQEALAQPSSTDSEASSPDESSGYSYHSPTPLPVEPRAERPAAPPAAPPPLLTGAAQTFDEPVVLDGAPLGAPPALSASSTASSSSWQEHQERINAELISLEQQMLAEALEGQLTGPEAIEVSKTQ